MFEPRFFVGEKGPFTAPQVVQLIIDRKAGSETPCRVEGSLKAFMGFIGQEGKIPAIKHGEA